jgi:hypothetical protein
MAWRFQASKNQHPGVRLFKTIQSAIATLKKAFCRAIFSINSPARIDINIFKINYSWVRQ